MPDADAQPDEIVAAEMIDNVAQSIVAAVAAALLEARCTGRQIEFIVHDHNTCGGNLVETCDRTDRFAAAIHEAGRFRQPAFATIDNCPAEFSAELCFDA